MGGYISTLQFNNYIVTKASYFINKEFDPPKDSDDLSVDFDIQAIVKMNGDDSEITLIAEVGNAEDSESPFVINVEIVGLFSFEGNDENKTDFMIPNSIAVLFPYLRSIVSELSVKSNIFPDYRLPLLNIYKFLEDKNKINIIKS